MTAAGITRGQARFAVVLLFGVNFLNYIDRYVVGAVAPTIQAEFGVSDTQIGWIGSMFMVAYMAMSPVTGVLGDRFPRRYLVGTGVLLWSLATAASGLAQTYRQLLVARCFIGVGEAGFGSVAPTLISDLFPKERRGRMLAYFYVAIPVGGALGFLLGGYMGEHHGWRSAFYVAGLPGILLGLLAFFMKEPRRGAGDGVTDGERRFALPALRALLSTPSFVHTTLGLSAMTFALGGMAYWMPTFLSREKSMPLDDANALFGGIMAVAGLVGTFLGGWLGDRLQRYTDRSYLLVSGIGMILAAPCAWTGIVAEARPVYVTAWFLAGVFVFLNTGPANAVLVNVALPEVRATGIAASIFAYHLLGDVPSPWLIGKVSDAQGLPLALQLTTTAMVVAGVFYLLGARTLGADTRRVQEAVTSRATSA